MSSGASEDESDDSQHATILERDPIDNEVAESILRQGTVDVLGQMPWSSNATLLCNVSHKDHSVLQAIYKPLRGERPLWDFPDGLYRREVACYELAKAIGWDLVPPTVEIDGPAGVGSIQLFMPCDFNEHYLTLKDLGDHQDAFQRLTAFDVVANSTDRKSGHVLLDRHGHIWAIDNGLSFHQEFKLRTVIWDFAGEKIPGDILSDLDHVLGPGRLDSALGDLIDYSEIAACQHRTRTLLDQRRFPVDETGRRWPWPLV